MTAKEFHIGLDLGLQQLNSNLFNRLEPEDKDFIINDAIVTYLNSFLDNLPDNVSDLEFYSEIYPLIHDKILPTQSFGDYTLCILPFEHELDDEGNIRNGGTLIAGVKYKLVITSGVADLSPYGGVANSALGTIFTCNFGYADVIGSGLSINPASYLIENGDVNDTYNTLKTYNVSGIIPITNLNTKYKQLTGRFNDVNSALRPINHLELFKPLQVVANIEVGYELSNVVSIEKDEYYKVYTNSLIDLSSIGGYQYTANTTVFKATTTMSIVLPSSCYLKKCKEIPVIILEPTSSFIRSQNNYDVNDYFLIGEFVNNKLKIYSNQETINYVRMVYISKPNNINVDYSITSDLPTRVHRKILDVAFQSSIRDYGLKNAAATGQLQPQQQ